MKQLVFSTVLLGVLAVALNAASDPAEIKLRDMDYDGLMGINSPLSLKVTFDVKKEDCLEEVLLDFFLLLTPRKKERGDQFFHCRTVHRFLEEGSGYTSGVSLNQGIVSCIQPRDSKYAVVVTYGGREAAVENSEKDRWWEDVSLGPPVENVLGRFADVPIVRAWESGK